MFRKGIRKILDDEKADLKVVGEADDGLKLMQLLEERVIPDLIILDISMPNLDGLEAARKIKCRFPNTKVLILSMHNDKEFLQHAMATDADGYLLKNDAAAELFVAIDTIRSGKTYISPTLSKDLTNHFISMSRQGNVQLNTKPLSPREKEILKLIAKGKTSKEIGEILFISHRTVDNHRTHILEKLNLKNIPALVQYAIKHNYI